MVATPPEVPADENEPGDEGASIARMEEGLRAGGRRLARSSRLRQMPSATFLAAMCAYAVSPVIATAAGMDPVGLAGMNVLSALGSGVLGGLGYDVLKKLRPDGEPGEVTERQAEIQVRELLEQHLDSGDAHRAESLSADIFALFTRVGAGKIVAEATEDVGTRAAVVNVLAAVNQLSEDFGEGSLLLEEVIVGLRDVSVRVGGLFSEISGLSANDQKILRVVTGISARLDGIAGDRQIPGDAAAPEVAGCPYLGLMPFKEKDARVFYGREEMVDRLVEKVARQAERGGLIVVTGASGAGKSSLLNAGLLPVLADGDTIAGSEDWIRRVITPSDDPLGELAALLGGLAGGGWTAIEQDLAARPDKAHLTLRGALVRRDLPRAASQDGAGLLLIVDQFEQIFTLNSGPGAEEIRKTFITALRSLATAHGRDSPAAMVVLAVRGDYFEACVEAGGLAGELESGLFIIEPMADDALGRAITGPAGAARLGIEDGLVQTILDDVRTVGQHDVAGVLPLLSAALRRTWEYRDGDVLTIHGYGRSGGVRLAVQRIADQAYAELSEDDDRELARGILCQLTVISHVHGRTFNRRPVPQAEIYRRFPDAGQRKIDEILDLFADKRLIVADNAIVELTHDVLLTAWPLLRGWLEEDQADLLLLNRLPDDAAQWRAEGRDDAFLYRGPRLAAMQELDDKSDRDARYSFPSDQRDFLTASIRAATRRTRVLRVVAGTLVVLLIATGVGAGLAIVSAANANRQRDIAISGQLAVLSESLDQSDLTTASRLAAAAWRESPTDQARESLLDVLAQPGRAVLTQGGPFRWAAFSPGRGAILATVGSDLRLWDVAAHSAIGPPVAVPGGASRVTFSPSGSILATADGDGTARLWDVKTRRQIGAPIRASSSGAVNSVAFSRDGSVLATADGDGTARLWDVKTRRQIGPAMMAGTAVSAGGQVTDVAFSPDGRLLATASLDGTARLWNLSSHRQVGAAMTDGSNLSDLRQIRGVVFNPDGSLLATVGGNGYVQLWHVASRRQDGRPIGAPEGATDAAFTQQGLVLVVTGNDGGARLWNIDTRTQITAIDGASAGDMTSVVISPSGALLATASANGEIGLWDITAFHNIGPSAHVGPYGAAAFSPDGRVLATAGFDHKIRFWDLASGRPSMAPVVVNGSSVSAVAFSPGGTMLAIGTDDGTIRVRDLASGHQIGRSIVINGSGVSAVAFSPGGTMLATGTDDGTVRLWNLASGRQSGASIPVHAEPTEVAFSPDATMLATVTPQGFAGLREVTTHQLVNALPPMSGVNAVAFSPDGATVATAQTDGTARLWDIATGGQIGGPMVASGVGGVQALAFNHDGTLLATAGYDGSGRLWDVTTRHQIGPSMQVASAVSGVQSVAFGTDDATLAALSPDEIATIWNVALPVNLTRAVCDIADGPLTRREWSTYIQSAPYVRACLSVHGPRTLFSAAARSRRWPAYSVSSLCGLRRV